MVCINTFTKRQRSAFTLVELLITLGVGGLLLASVALISENFMRSVAFLTNSVEMDAKSRIAFDRLSREIRQCDAVQSCSDNELVLRLGTNLVHFVYKPDTRHLMRYEGEDKAELYLGGCDFIRFDLYQRNLRNGKYDNYPAATPASCKVVQVSWICSRELLGAKASTATMQSAKVVIRKQHEN
jgi:prepilin-type N-terminal cleavage/methylation domain-containing protein